MLQTEVRSVLAQEGDVDDVVDFAANLLSEASLLVAGQAEGRAAQLERAVIVPGNLDPTVDELAREEHLVGTGAFGLVLDVLDVFEPTLAQLRRSGTAILFGRSARGQSESQSGSGDNDGHGLTNVHCFSSLRLGKCF